MLRRPVESKFAALVGVHDHSGRMAAADRHRHRQRAVGQFGVMVLAERKPQHPPEPMSKTLAR
jgi:hypothetical protein